MAERSEAKSPKRRFASKYLNFFIIYAKLLSSRFNLRFAQLLSLELKWKTDWSFYSQGLIIKNRENFTLIRKNTGRRKWRDAIRRSAACKIWLEPVMPIAVCSDAQNLNKFLLLVFGILRQIRVNVHFLREFSFRVDRYIFKSTYRICFKISKARNKASFVDLRLPFEYFRVRFLILISRFSFVNWLPVDLKKI